MNIVKNITTAVQLDTQTRIEAGTVKANFGQFDFNNQTVRIDFTISDSSFQFGKSTTTIDYSQIVELDELPNKAQLQELLNAYLLSKEVKVK